MDVETTFRNLVKNHYMPDFNYAETEFSFQTVFALNNVFSYCMCRCGFDHEFLDYIKDSGEIDVEKFENIVKCVTDGQCPHVNDNPEDFIKETKIYGIHIAIAVGTNDALLNSLQKPLISHGSLFHLDPFAIAVLKNRSDVETMAIVRKCFREKWNYWIKLVTVCESADNTNVITFKEEKVVDFLSRKNDTKLLESYINMPDDYESLNIHLVDAFRLSLQHNLEDVQERLTANITDDVFYKSIPNADMWIVYYDNAKLLDKILTSAERPINEQTHLQFEGLSMICDLLNAQECQKVILKHGLSPMIQNMSDKEKFEKLLILLFLAPAFLKEKIIPTLKSLGNLVEDESKQDQTWQYIQAYTTMNENIPDILRAILDCGLDLNVTDLHGCCLTPLTEILMKLISAYPMNDEMQDLLTIRQTIELYLYENLDTEINEDAVALALNADKRIERFDNDSLLYDINFFLTGTFIMDGEINPLFGHYTEEDFAMNYMMPLLLESGFAFQDYGMFASTAHGTGQELMEKIDGKQTNEDETDYIHDYIHSYMENPRSLKHKCRDALRTHFKGRQIHRFVEMSDIPQSVKDFILLKTLLKTTPAELLK